ncbi:ribonuclease P protein component [Patescibacteria group bacterium]|nr:ribonuclease P protein component [Patescibacteria group bacterium]
MLPATARLTRAQCSEILKNPTIQSVFNRLGTLKYIKSFENKGNSGEKYGLSVITGAKIQKKAVRRNKIRRQIYTIFSQYSKKTDSTECIAMLYVSKQSYLMSFDELSQQFYELLKKTQKNTR